MTSTSSMFSTGLLTCGCHGNGVYCLSPKIEVFFQTVLVSTGGWEWVREGVCQRGSVSERECVREGMKKVVWAWDQKEPWSLLSLYHFGFSSNCNIAWWNKNQTWKSIILGHSKLYSGTWSTARILLITFWPLFYCSPSATIRLRELDFD